MISVETRLTKIYELANLVLIGKVEHIDPKEKVIEVKVVTVSKGNLADKTVQIRFAGLGDSFPQVSVNESVVIFSGRKSGLVHVADTFFGTEALTEAGPPAIEVKETNAIEPTFPGRTVALVRLVNDIASGRPTLLNAIQHEVWRGGIIERGSALPQCDYVIAPDLGNRGKADVVIGNSQATQVLSNTGNSFKNETEKSGLDRARGKWAASGDINGDNRIDLLIGKQIWLNRGGHFGPGPVLPLPKDNDIIAVALLDTTGNGRPDALFLNKNGELNVFENPGVEGAKWKMLTTKRLWNETEDAQAAVFSNDWGDTGKPHVMVARASGLTRYALSSDGGAPADFDRLTSEPLKTYNEIQETPRWDVMTAVPLDINGDGRQDLIVILSKGGLTLVNRGFGTFLLNPLPTEALHSSSQSEVPWIKVTPKTRFCGGDFHGDKFDDLLIATPEGRLFELHNTPYDPPPNAYR